MRNRYFWAGLGALVVLVGLIYIVFNRGLMPAYTRHGVSVTVPAVADQPFEEAKQVLERNGLQVEKQRTQRFAPGVPRGEVVDQNPPPGAPVKPGRRVYLTVNEGEAPVVRVPRLDGISIREAKNRLAATGLNTGTVQPDSIPAPYPNTITRQSPAAGDSLKKGAEVNLWYSRGLGNELTTVPDVAGLTLAAARDTLLGRQLRFVVVDAPADSALADSLRIRAQNRPPGSRVRAGTELRIFMEANPGSSQPNPRDI
jgi:beta-lactam-binding protein with PASTA domain